MKMVVFSLLLLSVAKLVLGQPFVLENPLLTERQPLPRYTNGTSAQCTTSNGDDPASFQPPLYTEPARPQLHYSPTSGFMNDPNGLLYSNGTWHMYYQYNPNATVAGNQHWGHATSKDLLTWKQHLPAIAPEKEGEGIFSGSAVLDANNTSGFFDEDVPKDKRFVAIYTLNTPTDQNQNIAYSTDGQHYTKYDGNPVISLNTTQFRDPKVFYDDKEEHWVMTVSHPQTYQVGFYASKDLKAWKELSRFGPNGVLGYQYECPDLVQVPVKGGGKRDGQMAWVLIVSINPGAPQGGSFVEYFVGDWNGTHFVLDTGAAQIADFGKDWYAAQTFYNAPEGRTVGLAWASNWQYTNVAPTSPWRSVMSLPRDLTLRYTYLNPMQKDYVLALEPSPELSSLDSTTLLNSTEGKNTTVNLRGNGAFDVRATLMANLSSTHFPSMEFIISSSHETKAEKVKLGAQFGAPTVVYVDRRFAGREWADDNVFFTDRLSGQLTPSSYSSSSDSSTTSTEGTGLTKFYVRLIIDRSISEIFVDGGLLSSTILHFWDDDARPAQLSVGTHGGVTLDSISVSHIHSTWPDCST